MRGPRASASPAVVSPLHPSLLADPVAFLSAEHGRQTVLLAHLERVARDRLSRGARSLAQALIVWLTQELPVHICDEERSLYPRLRALDTGGLLERLQTDHLQERRTIAAVVEGLRAVAEGRVPAAGFADAACAFVEGHRRHLKIEEESVMPLARRVLTAASRAMLAEEMAHRRSGRVPPQLGN